MLKLRENNIPKETKVDHMELYKDGIKTMKRLFPQNRNPGVVQKTLELIKKVLTNLVENPKDPKFMTLKLDNKSVKDKIYDVTGAFKFLKGAGFE